MNTLDYDSRSLLIHVLEQAPLAVAWKDANLAIRGCNAAFAQLAGLPSTEAAIGLREEELAVLGSDGGAGRRRELALLSGDDVSARAIDTRVHATGTERRFETTRLALRSRGGDVLGVVCLYRELELPQSPTAPAEGAQNASGRFLSRLGHEIRTPMTAILGFANVLRDELSETEYAHLVDIIDRNGTRLLSLIDDLLDLARIESGRAERNIAALDPHALVAKVVDAQRARAEQRHIELRVDYLTAIPNVVRTDARRVEQVLALLVENAIEFTDVGEVSVQPAWVATEDGERLEFRVVDTGIGMSPERAARAFDPFDDAALAAPRGPRESGLGLVLARHIAELLGGSLDLESEPGVGTTFHFRIDPGRIGAAIGWDDAPPEERAVVACPQPRLEGRPLHRQRVLLAEDDDDNLHLIVRLLEGAGAEVTLADDGQAAVEYALAGADYGRPFDIVIMNTRMPRLDGLDATVMLRELGFDIPVVALSADASAAQRARCADAGCDDFVPKPIPQGALVAACARWMRRDPGTDAA